MIIQTDLTLDQKLAILTDAAKYDVACTSSGVDRRGKTGSMGNSAACGICHCFSADGRCISLLKILLTNICIYDCRYCINRASNDQPRTAFTPEEVCRLTMEFYKRNYIEGLFLSSGVVQSPDHTMSMIYEVLWTLRVKHHFRGYIHVKAIPGADPELIRLTGLLADRMSVNLELPTGDGLRELAPAKSRDKILTPMRQIQQGIVTSRLQIEEAERGHTARHRIHGPQPGEGSGIPAQTAGRDSGILPETTDRGSGVLTQTACQDGTGDIHRNSGSDEARNLPGTSPIYIPEGQRFVPAGQSTQMIIGATGETDYQILSVTSALYQRFDLKRVFYSAYTALNDDSHLPAVDTPPPLRREHRLYQADWLLRYYNFRADELLTEDKPWFNLMMDPKCDWAIRHLDLFPVEVSTADYNTLLRVPGIGVKSARRILAARRYGRLDFDSLRKMGVVIRRAGYFITCSGRPLLPLKLQEDYLTAELLTPEQRLAAEIDGSAGSYQQLSLFDDFHLTEVG